MMKEGPEGGTPHEKRVGMLVVSLRGVNFGFWSHLGCSGQNAQGSKKAWATPRSVSFSGLIQNFRSASPPLSYADSPPVEGFRSVRGRIGRLSDTKVTGDSKDQSGIIHAHKWPLS